MSINFETSDSNSIFFASSIVTFLFLFLLGIILLIISWRLIIDDSSIIPPPTIPTPEFDGFCTIISIFLSSNSPVFIFSLNFSLVFSLISLSSLLLFFSRLRLIFDWTLFIGGISMSRMILFTLS